jgi:hypothetical protein
LFVFIISIQQLFISIDKMASASASKNYIDDEVISFFQEKIRCGMFRLDGVDTKNKRDVVRCLRDFPDFVEFLKNLMFEEDDDMRCIEEFIAAGDASLADVKDDISFAEMEESEEDEEDFEEESFDVAPAKVVAKPSAAPVRAERNYYRERRAEREEADDCLLLIDARPAKAESRPAKAEARPANAEARPAMREPFPGQQFCKFYNGCTRKGCMHLHENNCSRWGNCLNARCMDRHPQSCRFGKKCRTPGCLYDHSGVTHSQ